MALNEGHAPSFHYELKLIETMLPAGAGMQVISKWEHLRCLSFLSVFWKPNACFDEF